MKKILLFISKNSIYFLTNISDFKKIISALDKLSPFKVEVIDITERPEMAEEYKIDALPTLIVNDKRYIGKPDSKEAIEIFQRDIP